MSIFEWADPDDGLVYEMAYIVTQGKDEGHEYVEYRLSPRQAGSAEMDTTWRRLPPWAMPPEEAIEFWHGSVSSYEPTVGIIIAMKDGDPEHRDALCLDRMGDPFWADLASFENISNPHGSEVSPGMKIRAHATFCQDVNAIRAWLVK
jgi:hypothetical protein